MSLEEGDNETERQVALARTGRWIVVLWYTSLSGFMIFVVCGFFSLPHELWFVGSSIVLGGGATVILDVLRCPKCKGKVMPDQSFLGLLREFHPPSYCGHCGVAFRKSER